MLKLLAILFMTLDHIGAYWGLYMDPKLYLILRVIGRLAFPIFAWELALGFRRTHNLFKYALRLFALAVVSQLLFNPVMERQFIEPHPNVLFTLSLGLVLLTSWEMIFRGRRDLLIRMQPIQEGNGIPDPWHFRFNPGFSLNPVLAISLGLFFFILSFAAAIYFELDYDVYGLLTILLFRLALNEPEGQVASTAMISVAFLNILFVCGSIVLHDYHLLPNDVFYWSATQGFSLFALPLIFSIKEKGKKPSVLQRSFFYFYYPLHILLILYLRAKLF